MYNNTGSILGVATGTGLALTGHTFGLSAVQFLIIYVIGFVGLTLIVRKLAGK